MAWRSAEMSFAFLNVFKNLLAFNFLVNQLINQSIN